MIEDKFFAEEITFDYPGKEIGKNEIDEIDDFPGKEDFIEFYTVHNGLDFTYGAWFFPEDCYNVPMNGDPYITLYIFLPIPVDSENTDDDNIETARLNTDVMKDLIVERYDSFEDFTLFHIPFALDVINNPFWIDIQSGEIKYIDFEESVNPDDVITVASSFKEFCKHIKKRRI